MPILKTFDNLTLVSEVNILATPSITFVVPRASIKETLDYLGLRLSLTLVASQGSPTKQLVAGKPKESSQ